MKNLITLIAGGVLCATISCAKEDPAPEKESASTLPANVVVEVNGAQLTAEKMEKQISQVMQSPNMRNIPPQMMGQFRDQISGRVIDSFITQELLIKEAERLELKVEQKDIDEVFADITKSLPEGVTMEQHLERYGLTKEQVTKDLSRDLKIKKLVDLKQKDIPSGDGRADQGFLRIFEGQVFLQGICQRPAHPAQGGPRRR